MSDYICGFIVGFMCQLLSKYIWDKYQKSKFDEEIKKEIRKSYVDDHINIHCHIFNRQLNANRLNVDAILFAKHIPDEHREKLVKLGGILEWFTVRGGLKESKDE